MGKGRYEGPSCGQQTHLSDQIEGAAAAAGAGRTSRAMYVVREHLSWCCVVGSHDEETQAREAGGGSTMRGRRKQHASKVKQAVGLCIKHLREVQVDDQEKSKGRADRGQGRQEEAIPGLKT